MDIDQFRLSRNSKLRGSQYSTDELDFIITTYNEIKNPKNTALYLRVPYSSLLKIIDRHSLEWYGGTRFKSNNYVELWDSVPLCKKAYICGLFASDGCLSRQGVLSISLNELDKDTVYFISRTLTNPPLKVSITEGSCGKSSVVLSNSTLPKFNKCYRVAATLPTTRKYMADLGVTPAKSLTLNIKLDDKSPEFLWYFIRGVIDGDGWVVGPKEECTKYRRECIGISSSSNNFITNIQQLLGGNIEKRVKGRVNPVYVLTVRSAAARQLALLLPTDDFTMSRKTEKIISIRQSKFRSTPIKPLNGSLIDTDVDKYWY